MAGTIPGGEGADALAPGGGHPDGKLTLTAHAVAVPLVRPFVTAVRRTSVLESVLVEVRNGDGNIGWGEAPISAVTGATTAGVVARGPAGPRWRPVAQGLTR